MGMSASQARYLSLTSNQSNIQFEGQQINQQRTTLANNSATLNNSLLNLTVPTPPSTTDYKTVNSSFSFGSDTCSIKATTFDSTTNTYNVTYTTQGTETTAVPNGAGVLGSGAGGYTVGGNALSQVVMTPGDDGYDADLAAAAQVVLDSFDDPSAVGAIYSYTTDQGETYFYTQQDLENTTAGQNVMGYSVQDVETEIVGQLTGVGINWDNGRMTSITMNNGDVTMPVNISSSVDETAYNDAMNQYEYDKAAYEKTMADINAKMEVIQSQDKKLELKLKQLDTENNAIQTELDAVKKVIEKNVESTFKTFG